MELELTMDKMIREDHEEIIVNRIWRSSICNKMDRLLIDVREGFKENNEAHAEMIKENGKAHAEMIKETSEFKIEVKGELAKKVGIGMLITTVLGLVAYTSGAYAFAWSIGEQMMRHALK